VRIDSLHAIYNLNYCFYQHCASPRQKLFSFIASLIDPKVVAGLSHTRARARVTYARS